MSPTQDWMFCLGCNRVMKENPQPKFKKGDIVRVVDEPYEDCPFEWIGEMDDYCGQTAVITSVTWTEWAGAWDMQSISTSIAAHGAKTASSKTTTSRNPTQM